MMEIKATENRVGFVPVAALDPRAAASVGSTPKGGSTPAASNGGARRGATRVELIRGLVKQAPFVAKNFQLYFRNGWRRHVLHTKVVAPYAVTFYVTHKCNLDCSYCTQKEPEVFSQELPTAGTLKVLAKIRRETDSVVITGGEPTLRADIETIVEAARFKNEFRSVLLITNGTLLDRKPRILDGVTGLVVSLDALQADPTNALSKPAALPKVMENLQFAKERLGNPRKITISTVIEEWNIAEVERLLDWCGEQGFVFAAQSAQMEKMPNLALLRNPKYQALVDTIIARRRENKQPINGTPRTIDTLLRFRNFECFPDDVSAGVSEWGCVLSVRAAAEGGGEFIAGWIVEEDFCAGEEAVWRHSAVRGSLLFIWECFVALLRE